MNQSYMGHIVDEVLEMIPSQGFNICEFDEYAPPGEKLTLLKHVDNYQEAMQIQQTESAKGATVYIYPEPDELELAPEGQQPAIKETEPYRLKIRDMGRFLYVNKGQFTKHQERNADHICAQLDETIWEMSDPRRPILPSERLGITNTHPGCKCRWQLFSIMDQDQETFDRTLRPTKNGQPLEDLKWNAKALQHIDEVDLLIEQKYKAGTLQPLDNSIREAVMELKHEFKWLSTDYIQKLKENPMGGKFLLIRAAAEAITDHRSEGEPYRRKQTARELLAMWRTGIGKHADINHDTPLKNPESTTVIDGEFDEDRKEGQFLVHETDKDVLNAIRNGKITAVSISGGKARQKDLECETGECFIVPKGVILGENDNVAFTYVVTDPRGWYYNGQQIPPARPGVKTTAIEILE